MKRFAIPSNLGKFLQEFAGGMGLDVTGTKRNKRLMDKFARHNKAKSQKAICICAIIIG